MKISIIIPTYNRKALLKETLTSILKEERAALEVIVIDDNSSDGTTEMLEAYQDPRLSHFVKPIEAPKGPSASRNLGVLKSTGDYIHFFDSDDLVPKDFYFNLNNELRNNESDAFLVRLKWFRETAENVTDTSGEFIREDFISRGIAQKHEFWTQNIIWKKSFLLRHSPLFDVRLTMSEDIEFAVRMLMQTKALFFSNTLFVFIRRHPVSLTFTSNLERECDIARSRYFSHKSILCTTSKILLTSDAKLKCSFVIRQSLLFLLKIHGANRFFIKHFLSGFTYSPLSKWPGYTLLIVRNMFIFLRKGAKWKTDGGYGRAF